MAETDSPYRACSAPRKRNEPSFVVEVVKKLAEIKNIPLDDLIEKYPEPSIKYLNFR